MSRQITGLSLLVAFLVFTPTTATADDWAEPRPRVFASRWGTHGFKVLPKSFETSTGVLFTLDAEGKEQVIWNKKLVNVPDRIFVAEDGKRVVTVDTYAKLGYEHSLVVYDDKGKVVADFKLEDLLTEQEIRDRVERTSPNRHWAAASSFKFISDSKSDSKYFEVTVKWGKVITVDLDSGTAVKSGITVTLVLTEDLYDPIMPTKAALKCVVRNDTSEPVNIPVGYDGRITQLVSGGIVPGFPGGMWLRRTVSSNATKSPESAKAVMSTAIVDPGKEQVIFELPLDDILAKGDKPNRDWAWDWPQRPAPPRSPIHKWREPGFKDQAGFQVKVQFGRDELVSNVAVLKVKPSDPAK